MKQNPWPFNDGLYFFHANESEEVGIGSNLDGGGGILGPGDDEKNANPDGPNDSSLEADGTDDEILIPHVLRNQIASALAVRRMGVGLIRARFIVKDGVSEIRLIWCEWIGNKDISGQGVSLFPEHDFAIVTFPYDYDLGRTVILPRDLEMLSANNKMRKSPLHLRKRVRKRLQDDFDEAIRRECSICLKKLLPGRDVATLLNRSTGKLACSSRNSAGEFHLYHVSCLIHWILHCEVEMHKNKSADEPIVEDERPRKSRKRKSKKNEQSPEEQNSTKKSVCCPDCQGSGVEIHTNDLEKPTKSLDEVRRALYGCLSIVFKTVSDFLI